MDANSNTCTVGNTQLTCFSVLKPEEDEHLNKSSVFVDFKKGETIIKQGSFASHIIVLQEGLANVYMEGGGEELILKVLPAVNIIGLSSLYEGNSLFHYSSKAYLDSKAQLIDINAVRQVINSNAQFAAKIIGLLSENTIIAYGRFFCLTKKQTYGRLADILLCLSLRVYKKNKFPLELTRKELAALASMSVESTTRILTKFRSDKLIEIHGDSIEIIDIDRLMLVSNNG